MENLVGKTLKEYREKAKLSQGEIAKRLGYDTPQFISNWERGKCGIPLRVAPDFCRITGMKPEAMKALLIKDVNNKINSGFNLRAAVLDKKDKKKSKPVSKNADL